MTSLYDVTMTYEITTNMTSQRTWTELLAAHSPLALWVDRLLTPLWYVVGCVGNILSAKIWISPRMRRNNSSAVYLIALAVSDFLFLALHSLQELKYSWSVSTLDWPGLCELYFLLVICAQYLSPTLVLCFTVERYIAVCLPFSKGEYCKGRRALRVVLLVLCLCISLSSIQAYFWTYNERDRQCEVRVEVLAGGERSLWAVWSWVTETLIFFIVPLVILVFNVLVILEIRRITTTTRNITTPSLYPPRRQSSNPTHIRKDSSSYGRNMTCQSQFSSQSQSSSGSATTTVMLLSVSFYVIVTTLPATLVYVLHSQFPEPDLELSDVEIRTDERWRRYLVYMTVRKIVEEVCLSHYACNVFLYCITGDRFRAELRQLLCGAVEREEEGKGSRADDIAMYSVIRNNVAVNQITDAKSAKPVAI